MSRVLYAHSHAVMMGMTAEPPGIDLAGVLLQALGIREARLYQPDAYEKPIGLAANGARPMETQIGPRLLGVTPQILMVRRWSKSGIYAR